MRATPLEPVEFESASQRRISAALIPGDRIQGDLAKPDGAGPYPAITGLHGCVGSCFPLYPSKRTSGGRTGMSVSCQQET